MALSETRLSNTLKGDILSELQAKFPVPAGLLAAEITAFNAAQAKIADAIGTPTGADVVDEVVTNAVVEPGTLAVVPSAMSNPAGVLTGDGSVSVGTGTVL